MASVYKLPLAMAWADLVDRGHLDPLERLELTVEDRTPGATGVSLLLDRVELSASDTVRQMLDVVRQRRRPTGSWRSSGSTR